MLADPDEPELQTDPSDVTAEPSLRQQPPTAASLAAFVASCSMDALAIAIISGMVSGGLAGAPPPPPPPHGQEHS